jgi:hypothetical protein
MKDLFIIYGYVFIFSIGFVLGNIVVVLINEKLKKK